MHLILQGFSADLNLKQGCRQFEVKIEKKKKDSRGERKGKGWESEGDRDTRWGNGMEGPGEEKQERRAGRGPRVGLGWPCAGSPAPVRRAVAKKLSISVLALRVTVSPGAGSNKSLLFWERASAVVQPWSINPGGQIYSLGAVRRFVHLRENRAFSGDRSAGRHHTNYHQKMLLTLESCQSGSYLSCERGGLTFCKAGSLPL